MTFELPAPSAIFDVDLDDGAKIHVRRHGNPDGVRILLSHGNGFAADAYFPYWRHFLDKFDLVIFDFRNHGQNVPVEPSNHTYPQLTRDLERAIQEVRSRLGQKQTIGIFHSMSARTAMKHAIEVAWRWDALLLFDPPDVPPVGHPQYASMEVFERRLTEFANKRRRTFASIEELTQEYLQSRATRNWVPGEHELMARSVLRKNPNGDGYVLEATTAGAAVGATAPFKVIWAGDANGDCRVDIVDFSVFVQSFGKKVGDTGYDARGDLNGDQHVDIVDFSVLVNLFGTRCPSANLQSCRAIYRTVADLEALCKEACAARIGFAASPARATHAARDRRRSRHCRVLTTRRRG